VVVSGEATTARPRQCAGGRGNLESLRAVIDCVLTKEEGVAGVAQAQVCFGATMRSSIGYEIKSRKGLGRCVGLMRRG
jgi:hypothetical protein